MEIELEKTFLLKKIPEGLKKCRFVEINDIYIPKTAKHPVLRIRKKGDKLELTKKIPVSGNDASEQNEYTINLSEEEFVEFAKMDGKKLRKKRYYYPIGNKTAELDFYSGDLKGLALADVEFNSVGEKKNFLIPEFCLTEVTQEEFAAAGILAGKKYSDIKPYLDKYNYKEINFE